jgi:acid phosphatase
MSGGTSKRKLLLGTASLAAIACLVWLWSGSAKPRPVQVDGDEIPNFRASSVENARLLPPLEEIRFAEGAPSVSFYAIGDTGFGGEILRANAASMERAAESRPVGFALLLGDNFYMEGVETTGDRRWKEIFEDGFPGKALRVPFYAVLGNHDHRGSIDAQIEYTRKSARWKMPARWYTFAVPMKDGLEVQFFALDTQPIHHGWMEGDDEAEWLESELAKSKARWRIVFGHHPFLSHGSHGSTPELRKRIAPLLERGKVDLVLAGHDHDLQVIRSKAGWVQIVSGAGCSTRDTAWGDDTLCALAAPGYAWVGIGAKEMWIELATIDAGPRFRYRIAKD